MILETIKLERFYERLPLCASWIGFRKSGKSFSLSLVVRYLVSRGAFKRIILFLGNRFCNPELVQLVEKHFDARLIFSAYSEELLQKILDQQEKLRTLSEDNHCLIVFDDVYSAAGRHGPGMNKLFQSGRHYLISCITSCVNFYDIAPSARRSLDFCVLFSNITRADTLFLTNQFLNKGLIETARFALRTNKLYCGLVIETCPVQKLYLLKFKRRNKGSTPKATEPASHSEKTCSQDNEFQEESVETVPKVSTEKTVLNV